MMSYSYGYKRKLTCIIDCHNNQGTFKPKSVKESIKPQTSLAPRPVRYSLCKKNSYHLIDDKYLQIKEEHSLHTHYQAILETVLSKTQQLLQNTVVKKKSRYCLPIVLTKIY